MPLSATYIATIIKTIRAYPEAEWETFIREWMKGLSGKYLQVTRLGGPNDMGRDVVGFTDKNKYDGVWDNCQCKHYAKPIPADVALVDIAKIIFHSCSGEFKPPRRSDFFGPLGVSTPLELLLGSPEKLRAFTVDKWEAICAKKITTTATIHLEGKLKQYVTNFDFSCFGWKSIDEVLDDHRKTAFWAQRFGGLLPPPPSGSVPQKLLAIESRYVRHILDAYEEREGKQFADHSGLAPHAELVSDLHLHRERFFDAEAFAHTYRDQTEPGTVENFQDEIHDSVRPVLLKAHKDGFERLAESMQQAGVTQPASILAPQAKVRVKQGVCHQLANNDRLRWKTKK
jgi:hypothetical protein